MLEKIKQSNGAAEATLSGQALPEETKEDGLPMEKATVRVYSKKLQKDLLERAVFMSIKLGDFRQAMQYQKLICDLNETMYEKASHPL